MFGHPALVYRTVDEFLDSLVPFVLDGLASREPVFVAVGQVELDALRVEVGTDPELVLADTHEWHPHPASRLRAFHELVTGELRSGAEAVRLVGEPAWPSGPSDFVREWARYESALNVALEPYPVTLICTYDDSRLDPEIVADARRTHPTLRSETRERPSGDFLDPAALLPLWNPPLVAPPQDAAQLPLVTDLRSARRFLRERATAAGVPPVRTEDLVVATTEVLANAFVHAGGDVVLRAWTERGSFVCQVEDEGPGVVDPLAGYRPPGGVDRDGRGLWLARQLVDLLQIVPGPGGTTVRLHLRAHPEG
ncbi:MAG: anti-sigma factor RsbA family regulatory protein [Candidatus Rokuibacteriota bacterium]